MNFHLPYHFVPVRQGAGVSREDFRGGALRNARHDLYEEKGYSGRIVCRVVTETPVFVGAERDASTEPARVKPYLLGGQRALPASSLRGMFGALAEAASNSALRVLDTAARYSARKPLEPSQILSAIGMVHYDEERKRYRLQPLCVPTLIAERDGYARLPEEFSDLFSEPILKVYVGRPNTIRDAKFPYRTYGSNSPDIYTLPLQQRAWLPGRRLAEDQFQHRKQAGARAFVLSQTALVPGLEPVRWDDREQRIAAEYLPACVPGVMRVLGCWGNRLESKSIPTGKKHELFLPWPQDPDWPLVDLPMEVVQEFEDLCDARTEASLKAHEAKPGHHPLLPLEPRDTRAREGSGKEVKPEDRKLRLRHGDLVYFGVDSQGRINEISFTAIWRKAVKNGGKPAKAAEFFPRELWPLADDARKTLTAAELLFGFVETPAKTDRPADALAGRVRFSAATPPRSPQLADEVVLRVLDAPKPPCPSLYFKPKNSTAGGFVPKMALDAALHDPQGRKFYLHQLKGQPWRTRNEEENKKQKARVQPIAGGQEFFFHVDFDNLSEEELGLLAYALAPSEGFRHKIGMGKGIGLGSIHVQPLAYLRIDRRSRYSPEGLAGARYCEACLGADAPASNLPAAYASERQALSRPAAATFASLRDRYKTRMDAQIRQAIELIGDPKYVKEPVLQPLLAGQADESETFRWFVANETKAVDAEKDLEIPPQRQFLPPLTGRKDLPVLKQPVWQKRERGRW